MNGISGHHSAFSTSGEDVITRKINIDTDAAPAAGISTEQFQEFYEVERTGEAIISGDYKRVALQFPDELLHDSVPIYQMLKAMVGDQRDLYVLADTSYGSCCVDEVAAQHVDADAIVHYGHACMSQRSSAYFRTSRLPVIYVFGQKPINCDECVSQLLEVSDIAKKSFDSPGAVLLRYDVTFAHQAEKLVTRFREALEPLGITILFKPILDTSPASTVLQAGNESEGNDNTAMDMSTIFYVGGESLGLTNLLLTHASCDVYSYDPKTKLAQLESSRTNRLLMRRYAAMQKARDADVFGILVGTLGVASYLPLITRLREIISKAHKKSYTISVGKLNPSKLANFMEIECFVLVACPENSLVEAKEFLRPIVTPYELNVALRAEQSWTGRYVLDFKQLMSDDQINAEDERRTSQTEDDQDQPVFSLITGKYRHARRYGQDQSTDHGEASSTALVQTYAGALSKLSESAAGAFLQSRSYQGLETRIGEDFPAVLEQGRGGISRRYQDDHS